jgi:hypothetical protein
VQLIDAAADVVAKVDLLQGHDVGLQLLDDLGNATRVVTAVTADAPVHVV